MPRTDLADRIDRWARRARAQQSARLAAFGLAAGAALALALGIAARLRPLWSDGALALLSLAALLAGACLAALVPWLHGRDRLDWARHFDARFGLGERLSTALEIEGGRLRRVDDAVRRAQRADAESAAESVDIRRALPLRPHAPALAAAAALVATGALLFTQPNPLDLRTAADAAARRALQQQSAALAQTRATLAADAALAPAQRDAALRALDRAQQALADPDVTPEQALAALRDAESQLAALRDVEARAAQDALQQAGRAMPADPATAALADALRDGRLADAAEQLRSLAPRDAAEAQRTAEQLARMATALQPSDPRAAEALRRAAQELPSNDPDSQARAQESLEQAAQAMERAAQSQQANEALQRAAEEAQAADAALQAAAQSGDGEQPLADAQSGAQEGGEAGAVGRPSDGGSAQSGDGRGDAGHSEDTGTADEIYAPGRVRGPGENVALPAAQSDVTAGEGGAALPAPDAAARVPYSQVYGEYAAAADAALQAESIPASRRDVVREYFAGLGAGE